MQVFRPFFCTAGATFFPSPAQEKFTVWSVRPTTGFPFYPSDNKSVKVVGMVVGKIFPFSVEIAALSACIALRNFVTL